MRLKRGRPCNDESKDWSDVAVSQGTPTATRSQRRQGRILPYSHPRAIGRKASLLIPLLDLWPPELCRKNYMSGKQLAYLSGTSGDASSIVWNGTATDPCQHP